MIPSTSNQPYRSDWYSFFLLSTRSQKAQGIMRCISILLCAGSIPAINAFTASQSASVRQFSLFSQSSSSSSQMVDESSSSSSEASPSQGRREFVASSIGLAALGALPTLSQAADEAIPEGGGVTMFKTGSGLKYIEMEQKGDSSRPSPKYGQLVMIKYDAYMKLPNKGKKEKYDSSDGYVIKHGNGRMIPGLDEGLHTMKKGDTRRLIIPPKLGYIDNNLGPLPDNPFNRAKLNRLLDQMIAQQGGQLVFDVTLLNFFDDEADQGYYEDADPTPHELDQIFNRLAKGGAGLNIPQIETE
ncbi:unnamed protein product [Cylindrotheca closterium]|uniref:peptidylprolyl isomerase n=1 Tax=Cylindrotheca closterium TaxID=2856 RepID=A0AAD2JMW5_9STRA|nr:unnamed protein product [Cylindrotheca closterium]